MTRIVRALGWLLVLGGAAALPAGGQVREKPCGEIVLYNGRIATMDAANTTASWLVMRGDRIVDVGATRGLPQHSPCASLIDLGGRRVIPGMIDTHDHLSYFTARPGHYTVLDEAASIADVEARVRERAAGAPAGDWITSIGGWSLVQFAERRMPTATELDAATTDHPVLLALAGGGTANSLGRRQLTERGVAFNADGTLSPEATRSAINVLRAAMTFDEQTRALRDLMAYYSSRGVTTHIDNGGPRPPAPDLAGISGAGDGGLNSIDPGAGYLPHVALDREGRLPGRLRLMFYSLDLTPALPLLRQRFDNQFVGFGSEWLRVNGVGERVAGGATQEWLPDGRPTPQYEAALQFVAERGWTLQQHSNPDDAVRHIDAWERVNARVPLRPLRWTLAHGRGIDRTALDRLRAMGVGVSISGTRYLSDGTQPGPPIRTIVDSGVRASFGSDSPSNPPLNPWLHMYAMVTGRNFQGRAIEPDQTLTRLQALHLYTIDGAWFSRDEDRLGSLEIGKLGDLVVLSDDFLDTSRVPDEAIKRLRSVLTIVGGRVVYDEKVLRIRN